jgi:hypothetical protein
MHVYSFDDLPSFPVLETYSRVEGNVEVDLVCSGNAAAPAHLRVGYTRVSGDAAEVVISLGLPLVGIAGALEGILLEVVGDGSGCVIHLEASDVRGRGLDYLLGPVDFVGPGTCSAEAHRPVETWGAGICGGAPAVTPPVQFCRLKLVLSAACRKVDVGLIALRIGGTVRLVPTGI